MKKWLSYFRSYAVISLGAVIYALAFNVFYAPNDIAFGGVTGISQMINRLLGWPPIGVMIIVINIPLFILAWKLIGRHMLFGSLWAMFLSSVLLDVFGSLIQFPTLEEPLMACIFGGVFLGVGTGLVCREGASMGGTDIASRLAKLKLPTLSVGQLLMGLDLVVIAAVSIVFQQLNSALLGVVALFISTSTLDRVLFGTDPSKVAYIISDHANEISKTIIEEMHRGVTILHGAGAWSGAEKNVLLCAFKNRQIVTLKRKIKEIDSHAFLIVCDAYEVLGDGFLPHDAKAKK
jgi:uncharacterized membrane-anchored protein YitT (DUF2179 family)